MSAELTGECYVGGLWRAGSGPVFVSTAPADGLVVWTGAEAAAEDVDAAIGSALGAFEAWRKTAFDVRLGLVRRFAALLRASEAEFSALIAREVGKPLWDAATETAAMVAKAETSARAYLDRTPTTETAAGSFTARVSHRPHGVMAVIGPFNFPGHLPNGHIMPALIAGNTVIFKPSDQAPGVAELAVRLWARAGAPAGVVNLLPGGRAPAEMLVADDRINGVLFTGGWEAGRAIHASLAGKLEKIAALELGGNNPLIVWDAADLGAAARLIVKSAYLSAGQRCTCARRLIVADGPQGEAIVLALEALIDRLLVGRPDGDPQPFYGPVISSRAADAVLAAQARWIGAGGVARRLSRRLSLGPAFLSPGLVDVTLIADRRDEEVFGPMLQLVRVRDFDGAIREANATQFGLAAGLVSDDARLFERFAAEARAGVVNWNRQTTGASGTAPFGGVGRSGNHRPAGYYAADYASWPMASLIAAGPVRDDEPMVGILS